MPIQRTPTRSTAPIRAAWLLAMAWAPAAAISLAPHVSPVTLGAALDVEIGLSLEVGETIDPQCLQAEVTLGDRVLPAGAVRTRLTGLRPGADGPQQAQLRVQTTVRVDEPIVEIVVQAGCPPRLTRRYVAFADPPAIAPEPVRIPAPPEAAAAPAAAQGGAAARTSDLPPPGASIVATGSASAARRQTSATGARRSARAAADARNPAAAPSPAGAAPGRAATAAASRSAPPAREQRARLQLDAPTALVPAAAVSEQPVQALLSPQTLALVEQANAAVVAAVGELRAAQERVAVLERRVEALQAQARGAQAEEWRQLVQQAQTRQRWTWALLIAVLLLLALAGWLWWRVRTMERRAREDWMRAARHAPATSAPTPAASGMPVLTQPDDVRSMRGAGLAPAHQPAPTEWPAADSEPAAHLFETAPMRPAADRAPGRDAAPAAPTAPTAPTAALATHAVSTEELIDLEQQAEFFIVLGQDEAAVDLLMAHLRDSAGASPLPYLKLMEIYRRLGDEAAYRRSQERFNQRFNARAPDWGAREHTGRGLEGYPVVIAGLQRMWPDPLDAMAELEALLFRRGGGQVFDLEAYRDLLFLYGIARETHESGARAAGSADLVDVLLPLDTAPAALVGRAAVALPGGSTPPAGPGLDGRPVADTDDRG